MVDQLAGPARSSSGTVITVGASYVEFCGVREWARTLKSCMRTDVKVDSVWWGREDGGGFSVRTLLGAKRWRRELESAAASVDDGVILWHYSVFCFSVRGIPIFAPYFARTLRRTGLPVVAVLHEFAYPWRRRGWRGTTFAVTQRLALVLVLHATKRVVVMTEQRAKWLRGCRWLPSRPVLFAPVFSNVQSPQSDAARRGTEPWTVGVFGYGSDRMRGDLVMEAIALLRRRHKSVRLVLIGGSGRASARGESWIEAAETAGASEALEFTGPLEEDALARALSIADILVFPDEGGPSSRKTTLAAALAHGKCVVALAGPESWGALTREKALVLAEPEPAGLAGAIDRLLLDDAVRQEQGERARAFYERHMTPEAVAQKILAFAMDPS